MSLYSSLVRPALFSLDAETAHDLTMAAVSSPVGRHALGLLPAAPHDPRLRQRVLGLDFGNPIGLAAGLDKQGTAVPAWAALGFGFAEVGTVTPLPQPGNPRPRLFRLRDDGAIINRFGFNSDGAHAVARNLAAGVHPSLRVGINLGRNKATSNERAVDDYVRAAETLFPRADYFVVNVSSPNTAGLRDLQEARVLRELLHQVVTRVNELSPAKMIPVLMKVSPDMATSALLSSVDAAVEGGATGIIATNTTTARDGLRTPGTGAKETGGLSGAPLRDAANVICRTLFAHLGRRVPIIGVGGISTAGDAYERIRNGATLVQLYTALIYEGPGVVAGIVAGLSERLQRDGLASIHDAVGADVG